MSDRLPGHRVRAWPHNTNTPLGSTVTDGADEVFVNGDSFIPEAKALEPVFKARMFAEVQA